MGKKKNKAKFETESSVICDYIFGDYINNIDTNATTKVLENIDALLSNRVACKITGKAWTSMSGPNNYRIISKFIQNYNPKLKKYRRVIQDYDFGGADNKYANDDKRIVELAKYSLDDGTYCVQFDKSTYGIFVVKFDAEYVNELSYEFYIIGKKWDKWKKKFYNEVDKYESISKYRKNDTIYSTDGSSPNNNVIFKTFDKIVFKEKDKVMKYVDNFVENIPRYYSYGMVPKLSIMIYGEPGTGKSTVSRAIAKALGINSITAYSPSYFKNSILGNIDDRQSRRSFRGGADSICVFDDIDCICKSREEDDSPENAEILSNLLKFLDNPPSFDYKAKDGIRYPISIVVASTNYYDKLDNAVKRPGRFDLTINMGYFNKEEAEEMCNIYDLHIEDLVDNSNDKDFRIGPSKLQALCLENIDKSIKSNG